MKKKPVLATKQRGQAIEGLAIALVIIIGLGILIYSLGSDTQAAAKSSGEQSLEQRMIYNLKNAWADDQDFSTLTTDTARKLNVFPSKFVQGTSIVNTYGGTVTTVANTVTTANDTAKVTLNGYSQDGCVDVVRSVAGLVRIINVNGAPIKADGDAKYNKTDLGNACTATNTNSIELIVNKS